MREQQHTPGFGDVATWGGRRHDHERSCYQCLHGTPHKPGTCPVSSHEDEEDEGNELDSTVCGCDNELTMQELDTGKCQSCGGSLLL